MRRPGADAAAQNPVYSELLIVLASRNRRAEAKRPLRAIGQRSPDCKITGDVLSGEQIREKDTLVAALDVAR